MRVGPTRLDAAIPPADMAAMSVERPLDLELVERARQGDRDAWTALVRRHAPRLAAYLGARLRRPSVVERLVEDAIVLAYRHLDEVDASEGFAAWFRRVGAHLALRWYREHREEALTEPFPAERLGTATAVMEQAARMERLETALGALTDAQRMAVEQRYRGGLEGEDLSEVLHCDAAKSTRVLEDALAALERTLARTDG